MAISIIPLFFSLFNPQTPPRAERTLCIDKREG
eukprot:COSAG02_NODE_644_length_18993_cov_6.626389_15_plen_33_part_00